MDIPWISMVDIYLGESPQKWIKMDSSGRLVFGAVQTSSLPAAGHRAGASQQGRPG